MVKLGEIKELHKFEPKYSFFQFQRDLPKGFESQIRDSRVYKAVKILTKKAHPTEETDHEKRWMDFYVPLKRRGYFILIPLGIILYDRRFFLSFPHSQVEVATGKGKTDFYLDLIEQTLEFSRILKKTPGIVTKSVPYDMRTGRIRGKYVLEHLLPFEKKKEILKLYSGHVEKNLRSTGVSLNDYLNIAAICYKTAFGGKVKGLTAEEMYRKWADGRDCGMLKIKNKKRKEAFRNWLQHESQCGGHPFEIVFSWLGHGIHLWPPRHERPHFALRVTNYIYALPFLEMVRALIKKGIPFEAHELESVLDYLAGDSYFTVNAHGEHNILYDPGDRKLFKHIDWDELNLLKWK